MKARISQWAFLAALLIPASLLFTQCSTDPSGSDMSDINITASGTSCSNLNSTPVTVPLTEDEADALIFMREEEKLARDIYLALSDKWGVPIFANIAASEQRHMDAVGCMISRYQLVDPITDDTPGIFNNEVLAALYPALLSQGLESYEQALQVGATIEDLDINDLNKELASAQHTEVIATFENLARGSRNHLRSFVGELEKLGANYTPQYISSEEFEAIISSPMETGTAGGKGQGHGHG
ncbi:DUF2202 domain-containing protein [Phaeodactylibacter luteus]|nr:DUF2202 domain-containing protein [Phaeodactylibacter luteus]